MRGQAKKLLLAWTVAWLAVCAAAGTALGDDPAADATVASLSYLPAMHVFRRHAVDPEKMLEFYGDVLGFEPMPYLGAVGRVQAGASEFKLQRRGANDEVPEGGVMGATGFRLATFFFDEAAPLVARFEQYGYPVPEFRSVPGDSRSIALTADPDGQAVALVVVPDASEEVLKQFEIGLTVSDIEASRAFYREFIGLEELAPVEDPVFGTTKYPFQHGSTIISLRSFGRDLPADTSSGIIQYLVSDIDRVETLAEESGITIDRPLTAPIGASLRTLWLADPDGITNYITETPESRSAGHAAE